MTVVHVLEVFDSGLVFGGEPFSLPAITFGLPDPLVTIALLNGTVDKTSYAARRIRLDMSTAAIDIPRARRNVMTGLVSSTVVSSIGMFASFTVINVLGVEILPDPKWAGLPGAATVLGGALASIPLSRYMARAGRRRGLAGGFVIGAGGGTLAIAAAVIESYPIFLVAMLVFGAGSASQQLSRYAAADVAGTASRGKYIGFITWSFVAGAAAGPNLVEALGDLAGSLGLPRLTGPLLAMAAGNLLAAAVISATLRPDPLVVASAIGEADGVAIGGHVRPMGQLVRVPGIQVALGAMVMAQLVMVMVMSMTSVHMTANNQGWGLVGVVISGHMLGMFALSPLTGWVTDRLGRLPVIVAGSVTLIISTLLVAAGPNQSPFLISGLFLLGLGWNFCSVAGSTLLTDTLSTAERPKVQGASEFLIGAISGGAGVLSGMLFAGIGFAGLGLLGALLMVAPLSIVVGRARRLSTSTPPA